MKHRQLGSYTVSAIGYGAMPLSIEGHPDEKRAMATVHAALDAGVTLIDTADSYYAPGGDPGHNEVVVARALAAYPGRVDDVLVATKGGRGRTDDGGWTVDGDPRHLRRAAEASLKRLGVEAIGLYQLHKPDPAVPYAESLGALRELANEGKVRHIGLSNVTVPQIEEARAVLGDRLASVQNRYSPAVRDSAPALFRCAELGLAFLPWSPLGGISRSSLDGPSGLTAKTPFHEVAEGRGVSPQQVALAWLLSLSPTVVPIPGGSRPQSVQDSARAADLVLTGEELALLPSAAPSSASGIAHISGA
ncbi:aldo/keto reductase [Streptomyces sp. ISL-98]|uniref:aldo/keto reductase n=1 Tax=Streptomyces sp. ISL-98 TaxID=2819192 RepID=UPI001BE79941|nr:aldo/keto reductase [Streptomyces sp. ISL-98]MBT2508357.1 aldo/keto reductase [Streptomyces sp. ISL-98]